MCRAGCASCPEAGKSSQGWLPSEQHRSHVLLEGKGGPPGGNQGGCLSDSFYETVRKSTALLAAAVLAVLMTSALLAISSRKNTNVSQDAPKTSVGTTLDRQLVTELGREIKLWPKRSSLPADSTSLLLHPIPAVVVGDTPGAYCETEAACVPLLRKYSDERQVRWNFLVDVAGNVYVDRGWDAASSVSSWLQGCNIAVALVGNFQDQNATGSMMNSLRQLLEFGVSSGKLRPDYRLVSYGQVDSVIPVKSPGDGVLRVINGWPHRCVADCDLGLECLHSTRVVKNR
ncbi:peptidoglycan recognition protein 1-like [Schistocerca serialis cubense]|uniref:peptidoglycan recognition protein 1-like n=1 Tax=Schistocerca serialis cubense TaxID=2023355 RepID=UPI00214E4CE1|nr:peptidoglycan recognition protein 1-like [Schistocerca serialis cubense]